MIVLIVAMLVLIAIACASVWRAIVIWREPRRFEREVELGNTFFLVRRDLRRGLVRGWAPFAGALVTLVAFVSLSIAIASAAVTLTMVWALTFIALMGGFLVMLSLQFTVAWFNRPIWCVPPYLRHEPGVWRLRREAKAKAKAKRNRK